MFELVLKSEEKNLKLKQQNNIVRFPWSIYFPEFAMTEAMAFVIFISLSKINIMFHRYIQFIHYM